LRCRTSSLPTLFGYPRHFFPPSLHCFLTQCVDPAAWWSSQTWTFFRLLPKITKLPALLSIEALGLRQSMTALRPRAPCTPRPPLLLCFRGSPPCRLTADACLLFFTLPDGSFFGWCRARSIPGPAAARVSIRTPGVSTSSSSFFSAMAFHCAALPSRQLVLPLHLVRTRPGCFPLNRLATLKAHDPTVNPAFSFFYSTSFFPNHVFSSA